MNKTTFKNREDWLAQRNMYLGGSELAAILGLDEWVSPYGLWLKKTDREQPQADNKHTLSGRFLEDGIARYWEYETGHKLIEVSKENVVYTHPVYYFLRGAPDRRFFWDANNKFSDRAVLEVKTTMKIIDLDDVPYSWFIQPNYYTGLLKYKKFMITWFEFFTKELKWVEYDFNPDMFEMCTEKAVDFWNNHIMADVPPPLTTASDIYKVFPEHQDGKLIVATDDVLELYSKAIDLYRKKGELAKNYKAITDQVRVIMRDAEILVDPGMNRLFTFRAGERGRTLKIKEI